MKKNETKKCNFKFIVVMILLNLANYSFAQNTYSFYINVEKDVHEISPLIYGIAYKNYPFAKAKTMNGSRMTTFNWETNISNIEKNSFNRFENDYYLPFIMGVDSNKYNIPGITVDSFQERCNVNNQFSALTLPMTGYVSSDSNCDTVQIAPSDCWNETKNLNGGSYSYPPNINDGIVYISDFINYSVDNYGINGIDAYFLDNEPGGWYLNNPYIVGLDTFSNQLNNISYQSLLDKSINLAKTIKSVNPNALVFGPSLWGYPSILNLSDATDYLGNDLFFKFYMNKFKEEEEKLGIKLLDVFDFHWYPQADSVTINNISAGVVYNRLQAPRTLWDSTYIEPSWQSDFGPMQVLKMIGSFMSNNSHEIKMSVSEYYYGAFDHISGGIAQADALGIFGKEGVYFASLWPNWGDFEGDLDGQIRNAFDLYLNYDGKGGEFGNSSVFAKTNNVENSSVYASKDLSGVLHVIAINKSSKNTTVNMVIDNFVADKGISVYSFDKSGKIVKNILNIDKTNDFYFKMSPMSVSHMILLPQNNKVNDEYTSSNIEIYPNPLESGSFNIKNKSGLKINKIELYQSNGNMIKVLELDQLQEIYIDKLNDGYYFLKLYLKNNIITKPLIILNR